MWKEMNVWKNLHAHTARQWKVKLTNIVCDWVVEDNSGDVGMGVRRVML